MLFIEIFILKQKQIQNMIRVFFRHFSITFKCKNVLLFGLTKALLSLSAKKLYYTKFRFLIYVLLKFRNQFQIQRKEILLK